MEEDVSFFGEKSMDDLVKSYFKRGSIVKSVVIENDNFSVNVVRELVEICKKLGMEVVSDDYSEEFIESTVKKIKEYVCTKIECDCKKENKNTNNDDRMNDKNMYESKITNNGKLEELYPINMNEQNGEDKEMNKNDSAMQQDEKISCKESNFGEDVKIWNAKRKAEIDCNDNLGEEPCKKRNIADFDLQPLPCKFFNEACDADVENNLQESAVEKYTEHKSVKENIENNISKCKENNEQLQMMIKIEKSLRDEIDALQEGLITERKLHDFLKLQYEELQKQQKVEQNPIWAESIDKIKASNEYIEKAYNNEKKDFMERIQSLEREKRAMAYKIEDLEDFVQGLSQKIIKMKERKIDEELERE